jgi:GDP-L-fucose synthase
MTYRSAARREDFHPDTQSFFAGRKVLVLGGSGFIGSHVVEQLLELKAEPVVLSRSNAPPFLAHLGNALELIQGDIEDSATMIAATRRAPIVLYLAARVAGLTWNAAHPATMFMDNMALSLCALRAITAAQVERLLITSSACVYPRHCTIPTPEDEGFLDQPEPTNAGYGWAKRMEEFLGQKVAEEFGIPVAIARPYNAYGPRDDFDTTTSHVIAGLIRKAMEAKSDTFPVWGDGTHSRGFLYVDDFARGLLEVTARYAKADPINLGASEETTIREIAELIAAHVSKIIGKHVRPVFDPQGPTGQPRRACDTRKALTTLGYRAKVSLDEGLRRTVEWYFRHADHAVHSHA